MCYTVCNAYSKSANENCFLKGTVQWDFRSTILSSFKPPGSLTNRLKYFWFRLRFRQFIKFLSSKILTPHGDWLASVSDSGESCLSYFYLLPGVWYRYHGENCKIFKLKNEITYKICNQNQKYFIPLIRGRGAFVLWKTSGGQKSCIFNNC